MDFRFFVARRRPPTILSCGKLRCTVVPRSIQDCPAVDGVSANDNTRKHILFEDGASILFLATLFNTYHIHIYVLIGTSLTIDMRQR
jgi:hypothetical protein